MGGLIEAWFDGVCEPRNPGGHAAYGALVKLDGRTCLAAGEYIGCGPRMSNNVAEYSGCIRVLRAVLELPGVAIIKGDSKLVINQLSGAWKIRGGLYVPYFQLARDLVSHLRDRITLQWVPRHLNAECDELSKAVLRERGIEFRIQPEVRR